MQQPTALKIAPVSGVVTINGKPAADIMVTFMPNVGPDTPAITSTATTGPDGKFTLTASNGQPGALVGPCKVLLADLNEERPPQGQPLTRKPRLTPKYMVLGPETLEVTVKEGSNDGVEIDVRS